jgi:hypothetical protein
MGNKNFLQTLSAEKSFEGRQQKNNLRNVSMKNVFELKQSKKGEKLYGF